jgi:hypothetical protein
MLELGKLLQPALDGIGHTEVCGCVVMRMIESRMCSVSSTLKFSAGAIGTEVDGYPASSAEFTEACGWR